MLMPAKSADGSFLPVPLLVALAMIGLLRALRSSRDTAAFVYTLLLVFLGYSGLGISLWPNIVPPALSIHDAAGPPQSLGYALVGTLLIIPLILMYTAWATGCSAAKCGAGMGVSLMASPAAAASPRWRIRLAWLAAFWISGVATMGLVTGLLRWLMRLASLAS